MCKNNKTKKETPIWNWYFYSTSSMNFARSLSLDGELNVYVQAWGVIGHQDYP
jgi:hypothetical protein